MDKLKVFITVGTGQYKFDRMLKQVSECLGLLDKEYELIVQYGSSTPFVHSKASKSVDFLTREEAEDAYANSDLIFSHCGIGSIYNSLLYNRPTVILPRLLQYEEASDDHQLQIATEIANHPLVLLIHETDHSQGFLDFVNNVLPKPKKKVDLTNYKLAEFIKSRLYLSQPEELPILTVVSAGGHLTQALCIMKKIKTFHLVTSVDLKSELGAATTTVVKGTQFNPFIHFWNVFVAINIIRKTKPAAIFSTGGPICLPYAIAAKLLSKRFIYLDTLSRVEELSNTAQFLYKRKLASEIYVQWESIANRYDGIECHGKTFDICGENMQ